VASKDRFGHCEAFLDEIVKHTKDVSHVWVREGIRTYVRKLKNELCQIKSEMHALRRAERQRAEGEKVK